MLQLLASALAITEDHESFLQNCRNVATDFTLTSSTPCDKVKHTEALLQMQINHQRQIEATRKSGTAAQIRRLQTPTFKEFFVLQALREEPAIITGEVHKNVTGRLEDVDDNLSSLAPIV